VRRLLPLLVLAAALALPAPASAQISVACFAPSATPCSNVWHNHDVNIQWGLEAPWAQVSGCVNQTISWDTPGEARGCTAHNGGDEATRSVTIKLDKTAPTVLGGTASRPPDHNGWYRSPVGVTFSGTDALSGLVGCSATTYSSASAGPVNLLGRCQDRAGNVSAAKAFPLRFDAAPPSVQSVRVSPRDDAVRVRWEVTGASAVTVWRTRAGERRKVASGGLKGTFLDRKVRNGRQYTYTVSATDQAGNVAAGSGTVVPGPQLLGPSPGAIVTSAPKLRWTKVRGADYYNVQLFRGGRKILSAWPSRTDLQLDRKWRYAGRRHRLVPGEKVRWFVWPGRGPRARSDYGPLVGSRTFTLRAP
jgi:hypothetical protein